MNILIVILTVFEVITALLLIGLVLIQQSKSGGGLGAMGGGVTESVLGAGAGNFFTKATVVVASLFMGITLLLVIVTAHRQQAKSVIENELPPVSVKAEVPPVPPAETATATTAETVKPAVETAAPAPVAVPAPAPVVAPVVAPVPAAEPAAVPVAPVVPAAPAATPAAPAPAATPAPAAPAPAQ